MIENHDSRIKALRAYYDDDPSAAGVRDANLYSLRTFEGVVRSAGDNNEALISLRDSMQRLGALGVAPNAHVEWQPDGSVKPIDQGPLQTAEFIGGQITRLVDEHMSGEPQHPRMLDTQSQIAVHRFNLGGELTPDDRLALEANADRISNLPMPHVPGMPTQQ